MKKTFLLALLCCLFAIGFAGNPVPANDARTVSVNFIKSIYPDMNVTASDFVLQHTEMDENGEPLFYQFSIGEQGFILISANDAVEPILGYSLTNNFDKNLPIYAVSVYRDMIADSKDKVDEAALRSWKKLLPTRASEVVGQYISSEVKPLVTSKWNQGEYFNYLCPAQPDASQYQRPGLNCDNHVPVGCVATAMAQVLFYYRYPEYGTGGIGYQPINYMVDENNNPTDTFVYPWQVQNFNTLHEYDAMPSTLSFYTGEVAKLSWHLGISVQMNYGPNSSGAFDDDALTSLKNYWGYDRTAQIVPRSDFTTIAKWQDTIRNELSRYRPIYYTGHTSSGDGHAFIVDGFQVIHDVTSTPHYSDTIAHIDHIDTLPDIDRIDTVPHTETILDSTVTTYTYDTIWTYTYDTSYFYTHTDTTYIIDTLSASKTMVHVNWGWGGSDDGYFALASSGVGEYSKQEQAMIGLIPANQAPKETSGDKRLTASRGSISDGAGNINYQPNTDRTWTIAANSARTYTFKFSRLATEADNDVIIFYKNGDLSTEVKRVSGNQAPSQFSISADSVTVRFLTNDNDVTDKGFVLEYSSSIGDAYCSESEVNLTGSGTISDKGESGADPEELYKPDKLCKWKIDGSKTVYFSYPKIELGLGDYIDIYEYTYPRRYELLKRIDVYNWPDADVFAVHSPRIRIHFMTDNYEEGSGFELTYQIIDNVKENGISDLSIFPNPASSTMNVMLTTEEAGQLTFRITDMTGRTISTENVENYGGEMMHTLNVSNLAKGFYLLSIEGNQGSSVHKFIVE